MATVSGNGPSKPYTYLATQLSDNRAIWQHGELAACRRRRAGENPANEDNRGSHRRRRVALNQADTERRAVCSARSAPLPMLCSLSGDHAKRTEEGKTESYQHRHQRAHRYGTSASTGTPGAGAGSIHAPAPPPEGRNCRRKRTPQGKQFCAAGRPKQRAVIRQGTWLMRT